MGKGQAYYQTVNYLTNITTGTTIAGSPTIVSGCAYASFQVVGMGSSGGGPTNNAIIVQASLGQAFTGSPTWVAVSVTNANNGNNVSSIVADGIYVLANTPYFSFVRPFITTLSQVNNGRMDVFGVIESQTSGE